MVSYTQIKFVFCGNEGDDDEDVSEGGIVGGCDNGYSSSQSSCCEERKTKAPVIALVSNFSNLNVFVFK